MANAAQIVTVGGGSKPKLGAAGMNDVGVLPNHSLLVDGLGRVAQIVPGGAPTDALLASLRAAAAAGGDSGGGVDRVVDCTGKVVLPGFVDGHTHAVFDGDRSHEHALKLAGATYEQVHEAGGGINFTVNAVRSASEERLLELLLGRLDRMMRAGTTTCEVKTGYGLDFPTELKMLRTIQAARPRHRMSTANTLLIHAVPKGRNSADVARDVVDNQLPALARLVRDGQLAAPVDFIDVFCEHGASFFTPADTRLILEAGQRLLGARASFHGDELSDQGCGELAASVGAVAVSHLEMLNDRGVAAMARAGVHAVLLPTTAYLLRLPRPPTRKLIDAGAPVALASDFNPNAFCFDMPAVMNLACVTFGMTMAEALVASTINAASALGVAADCGSLEVGKRGDCVVLDAPKWEHVVYNMRPEIAAVFKDGVCVTDTESSTRRPQLYAGRTTAAVGGRGATPTPVPGTVGGGSGGGNDDNDDDDDKMVAALAGGIQLDPLPPRVRYDDADDPMHHMPHAPRRPIELTSELKRKVRPVVLLGSRIARRRGGGRSRLLSFCLDGGNRAVGGRVCNSGVPEPAWIVTSRLAPRTSP